MNRRTIRKKAIQALFQIDIVGADPLEAINNVLKEKEEADEFLLTLVEGTVKHIDEIDLVIKKRLKNWTFERIGNVDRNILRMALFEIQYMGNIPRSVTINEAVELAKLFGAEESGAFVNGVLENVKNESYKGEK